MFTLSPLATVAFVVVMLLMAYLPVALEREATRRCPACGTRQGAKHHQDCHYKDRGCA